MLDMPPTRVSRQDSIAQVFQPGPSNTKLSTKYKASKAAPKEIVYHPDIIEITDSEDDQFPPPPPPPLPLKRKSSRELRLERDVKKLKQENDEHKSKENALRLELALFKDELMVLHAATLNTTSSKDHMPIANVEDSVTCEVCTMKMWTPYILECGHTYCQSCLQDWFSTTLTQHMAAHPNFSINQPQHPYGAEMLPAHVHYYYMHLLGLTPPQPQYTCPICRQQVRNPPVEDFNLKKIVRAVASARGEASPRKEQPGHNRRKGKARARREDQWSGFFQKKT
ncbi:hypothetical protein J3R30DRAFT_3715271 [Lentinula aciculospora]|uniref:RING-type domain-containing protein n=1 Tax=Lentinula aciculospora TaxID=153920 RepID=A0A9W8ZWP5_9AGAR|nr:hypothetical protein J3R30DRAFT_3715271 [Lentinula aciculospora]